MTATILADDDCDGFRYRLRTSTHIDALGAGMVFRTSWGLFMGTIAEVIYRDTVVGTTMALQKAGTGLENRYVFDSTAYDIKDMASQGLVQIVDERKSESADGALITELVFKRLR